MPTSNFRKPLAPILAGLATVFLMATHVTEPSAAQGRWSKGEEPTAGSRGPGDLAVVDLRAFEIGTTGSSPRFVVLALVENQGGLARTSPWRLRLYGTDRRTPLAVCSAAELPDGRVAVCEMGLAPGALEEGESVTARLDRSDSSFHEWDGEAANDERTSVVNTIPAGGQVLRIARWDVQPRIVHGRADAQFRFSIEGAHLAWLLVQGEDPKLLAGHPSDGLISGRSKVRVTRSGPVTLVARNSLGAFVYETIPVLNTYDDARPDWSEGAETIQEDDGGTMAAVLPLGVYDVDENESILEDITAHLSQSDWAAALMQMRKAEEQSRSRPSPASALNPERLRRDR